MNMGMQFVGLCFLVPMLIRFLPLRTVLLVSLIMAFMSWNCYATGTDVSQMLRLSPLSLVNAAFFPIVRTRISNTFGAQTYRESLAAVGVLEQFASTLGNVEVSKVFSWTNTDTSCGPVASVFTASLSLLQAAVHSSFSFLPWALVPFPP